MFMKLVTLIILDTYLAADASLIIQDVDPDLTDVKERLAKVESKLSEMQKRLENVETVKESTTACKDGWMAYKGSCYFFGTTEVTFTAAEEQCKCMGAHLVNVENKDENNFLKAFMLSHKNKNIHYWVGITDEETENDWKLTKGDTVATFFDWGSTSEPKGGRIENCVAFASEHQYGWADIACSGTRRYLCEQI